MGIRRIALAGTAASTALLILAGAQQAAGAATTGATVDGVWRSDGYATVMKIEKGRATLYQTSTGHCLEGVITDQEGGAQTDGTVRFAATEQMLGFTLRPEHGRRGLVQPSDGSVGDRHLWRLPRLPGECAQPPATGPLATFDVFWQTYADNYPFFAAKGVDWVKV